MIMETLSCGYPVAPSVLGSAPITPPATPPDSVSYSHDCSPQLYSQTQYAQPSYSTTQLHSNFVSKFDEDANNNNHIYNTSADDKFNNNESSLLINDLSSLSINESEKPFSNLSPVLESTDEFGSSPSLSQSSGSSRTKSKKNSRSKSKSSTESLDGDRNRKDSFVYDVRLPDEQFLFFVPDLDLVKSHLMFAVREEVDVLKDRIVDLMDRIKHLECENTILKQYASPEVLQQLQSQMPLQLQQQQQPPHHSSTS